MPEVKNNILVPWDFSEISEVALLHAIELAKIGNNGITLTYVSFKEKELIMAREKLQSVSDELNIKYKINTNVVVGKGFLFSTISKIAYDSHSILVVMALSDLKKAKKALRPSVGSKVPFLFVQSPPAHDTIKEIVVPIDYDKKNRVQLNWVIYLAKFYGCNVNIIKPFISSNAKNELLRNNMYFARNILDSKKIIYGVRTAKREQNFSDSIYNFAHEIEADIIFVMSHNYKTDILKTKDPHSMSIKSKFPVLCIHPRTDLMRLIGNR
jgi:hypothetical protein